MVRKGAPKIIFEEAIAQRYDEWYNTPFGRYADEQERTLLLRLLQPSSGQSVLDVGCGAGSYLLWFAGLGLKPIGVDPSPSMLEVAREKVGVKVPLSLARAEALPFSLSSVCGASIGPVSMAKLDSIVCWN